MSKFRSSETRWRLARTALLFVGVSTLPATADVRDLVQANAARRAIIGDDRRWLNCCHVAASPLLAELGLKAATDAQLKLVANPPAGIPESFPQVRLEKTAKKIARSNGTPQ